MTLQICSMYWPFACTSQRSRDPLLGESSLVLAPFLRLDLFYHLIDIEQRLVVGHSLIRYALFPLERASFRRFVPDRKVIRLSIIILACILQIVLIYALNLIIRWHKLLISSLVVTLALIGPRLDWLFSCFVQWCLSLRRRVSYRLDILSLFRPGLKYVDGITFFMEACLSLNNLCFSLFGTVDWGLCLALWDMRCFLKDHALWAPPQSWHLRLPFLLRVGCLQLAHGNCLDWLDRVTLDDLDLREQCFLLLLVHLFI